MGEGHLAPGCAPDGFGDARRPYRRHSFTLLPSFSLSFPRCMIYRWRRARGAYGAKYVRGVTYDTSHINSAPRGPHHDSDYRIMYHTGGTSEGFRSNGIAAYHTIYDTAYRTTRRFGRSRHFRISS